MQLLPEAVELYEILIVVEEDGTRHAAEPHEVAANVARLLGPDQGLISTQTRDAKVSGTSHSQVRLISL
jgi:hypothetical protein